MREFVPVGLLGLLIAALLAAFMSTYAATVNAAPAYIVNDIYKRYIRPDASEKTYVWMSYATSIAVVVVGTAFGFFVTSLNDIVQWIVAALYGGYTASNLLKWYWWRFNAYGYFWGMVGGILAAMIVPALIPFLTPLYTFPIILVVSLIGCLVGSFMTEPDEEDVLLNFYLKVPAVGCLGSHPRARRGPTSRPGLEHRFPPRHVQHSCRHNLADRPHDRRRLPRHRGFQFDADQSGCCGRDVCHPQTELARPDPGLSGDHASNCGATVAMSQHRFDRRLEILRNEHETLLSRPNERLESSNGIYSRFKYPVLTGAHTPLSWRFDLDPSRNPMLLERMGINAVFNAGAIRIDDRILMVPRIEGDDRKSFFGVAESLTGVDRFRFWDRPIVMPETDDPDVNVYDMRLTLHEDGWLYGVFCTERKDPDAAPGDTSSAVAQAGIARTADLVRWERLPDLKSPSPQQRNVVLHPEFVNGKYGFYTRPQDGFIEAGSGGGIGWALCDDIQNAEVDDETIIDPNDITPSRR